MANCSSDGVDLAAMLRDARRHTCALLQCLDGPQWLGPYYPIVNPPLWEFGHITWFQEYWCLRRLPDGRFSPSMLEHADAWYNSSLVEHTRRWHLPLPSVEATHAYAEQVLTRVQERLDREAGQPALDYFAQLALFHEDMHGEAFHYSWQTHGYPSPVPAIDQAPAGAWPGDVELAGGRILLGATPNQGFVFDNEKWQHEVVIEPFAIARAPVTNRDYLAFVEDGGYRRRECWSDAGWRWREQAHAKAPCHWRQGTEGWMTRRFDRWGELAPDQPVLHVNWHEANAYCRWRGRRLPTEAEWEFAAAQGASGERYPWGAAAPAPSRANLDGRATWCVDVADCAQGDSKGGCRQMIGNVWEWTASPFRPYPGFSADPYTDYSQPWFDTHYVLRGGSFATRSRLIRNGYRNFYLPERRDIFAGFRTCALASG